MKTRLMALGLTATLLFWSLGCDELKPIGTRGSRSGAIGSVAAGDKLKVEFFIMSKCPYGVQVAKGIKPVLDEIGDWVDFHMDYIVQEKGGKLAAMHGEPELKGNIIQLCAMKHYPDVRKYMGFIDCVNRNWQAIPQGWESCASQSGLDTGKIKSCVDGNQGMELQRESMKRAQAKRASGSPTIFVAGEPYSGGRSKEEFMKGLCGKFSAKKPEACAKIPPPPPEIDVHATVITDKRCKQCQVQGLVANLKGRFFPKLQVKTLDYGTPEGKKMYEELKIKKLPVMLFEKGVEQAPKYKMIARWMSDRDKYKQLKIPARFDPTAEICDNEKDDTGNGKVDCADPTCVKQLPCRKIIPKKLEVFVMSQCPYGVRALDAMKEVLGAFGNRINFDVHYIADQNDDGTFKALHGQPEVDENIRHLCAKKYYKRNNKYMDYIWCRNKNYQSNDWKPCATGAIKAAVIEKCSTGDEGKKLHAEDIKEAKWLDISGSPTWLANNKHKFGGIAPEQIKNNFCGHNKGLGGCEKKLTGQAQTKRPSGSCGS